MHDLGIKGTRNRDDVRSIALQMPNQLQITKSYRTHVHVVNLEPETITKKGLRLLTFADLG